MKLNKKLRQKTKEFLLKNQKETYKMPLPIFIRLLLQYKGKGLLSYDMKEKMKLLKGDEMFQVGGMGVSK